MTILEKVLSLLEPTAKDNRKQSIILTLIDICQQEAQDYCHLKEYSSKLDNIVVQMVLQRYRRLNNEGVEVTNSSGVQESFSNGYTKDIYIMLNKHRKLVTIG